MWEELTLVLLLVGFLGRPRLMTSTLVSSLWFERLIVPSPFYEIGDLFRVWLPFLKNPRMPQPWPWLEKPTLSQLCFFHYFLTSCFSLFFEFFWIWVMGIWFAHSLPKASIISSRRPSCHSRLRRHFISYPSWVTILIEVISSLVDVCHSSAHSLGNLMAYFVHNVFSYHR